MDSACRPDLFDRIYFGRIRTWGSNAVFKGFFCGMTVLEALFVWSAAQSDNATAQAYVSAWPLAVPLLLGSVLWACLRFASYRATNMMLRFDSPSQWSIHMGTLVSLIPLYYACTPENLIPHGEEIILRAAKAAGLQGVVTLKSHLYQDGAMRRERMQQLSDALGIGYEFRESECKEELGVLFAVWLTILRNALYLRLNCQRLKKSSKQKLIPMRKFCFLSPEACLGVITITIPPRPQN